MLSSPDGPTRFYNDGPCHPITPLLAKAEKEYRKWFAKTADGVPKWNSPQMGLFGPGHEIRASKKRGQAQAAWIAIEGWQHFAAAGFDNGTIRGVVIPVWNVGVQKWAKALIRPDHNLTWPTKPTLKNDCSRAHTPPSTPWVRARGTPQGLDCACAQAQRQSARAEEHPTKNAKEQTKRDTGRRVRPCGPR